MRKPRLAMPRSPGFRWRFVQDGLNAVVPRSAELKPLGAHPWPEQVHETSWGENNSTGEREHTGGSLKTWRYLKLDFPNLVRSVARSRDTDTVCGIRSSSCHITLPTLHAMYHILVWERGRRPRRRSEISNRGVCRMTRCLPIRCTQPRGRGSSQLPTAYTPTHAAWPSKREAVTGQ